MTPLSVWSRAMQLTVADYPTLTARCTRFPHGGSLWGTGRFENDELVRREMSFPSSTSERHRSRKLWYQLADDHRGRPEGVHPARHVTSYISTTRGSRRLLDEGTEMEAYSEQSDVPVFALPTANDEGNAARLACAVDGRSDRLAMACRVWTR
jgi:hypothetical protein